MPDIKPSLYLEPFSKKKHCILQRNLGVILIFKHRMGDLIDERKRFNASFKTVSGIYIFSHINLHL